jgi:hypothetical protein
MEAQAALAEAASRATSVRRADRHLQWVTLCIAGCWLVTGAIASLSPDRNSPAVWVPVLVTVIGALSGVVYFALKIRVVGRARFLLFIGGFVVFQVWMGFVAGMSMKTLWWAGGQPSYHFGVTIAVGVIPLLILAWLLGRR